MRWLRLVTLSAALLSVVINVYVVWFFRPDLIAIGAQQERMRWLTALTHGGRVELPDGAAIEIMGIVCQGRDT